MTCCHGYTSFGMQPSCDSGIITSSVVCIEDIDCVGGWSSCQEDCENRVFTVAVHQGGGGAPCEYADNESAECLPGDDSCPPDIDCQGVWSACTPDCTDAIFTVSQPSVGNGTDCLYEDGDAQMCLAGQQECTGICNDDRDCNGHGSCNTFSSPTDCNCNTCTCSDGYTGAFCTKPPDCVDLDLPENALFGEAWKIQKPRPGGLKPMSQCFYIQPMNF